jgi:uncharacterized protein DUF5667
MTMGIRRESADLDRLLDRIAAGEEPEATGDLAPFLHPAQVARAAFVRSLPADVARAHLSMLREDRAKNVVAMPVVRGRGLRLAAAFVAAAVVLVVGAGSAVAASSDAVPGDPLYGVKRAVERISLAMHRDPVGRAALHLQFADERLDEVATLVVSGRDASELIDDLEAELNGAEQDALAAVALGRDAEELLAHVRAMIAKHIEVLNDVLGRVPGQAKDAIQHAIDNAKKADSNVLHGRNPGTGNKPSDPGDQKPTAPPGKGGNAPAQGRR